MSDPAEIIEHIIRIVGEGQWMAAEYETREILAALSDAGLVIVNRDDLRQTLGLARMSSTATTYASYRRLREALNP